ncbi:hypothetical protein COLO4_16668 [Corchorus olitorius]|uniref:Uncharacterized protein n=1 Tax=Corchorus olitorius TaxID=93759 RepID=A0A1R3JG46_9ROSI|nr:hypothetical protein COLO4_16668 [Corchorus olitorius]
MATPKEHIEQIRETKFSIGGEANPLTKDLHQAVRNLSAKLYTKDVHFLMELIQNAEDNEYLEGVDPSLEFVITSQDITAMGAPATLLMFNNENGFSSKNIESLCSIGRSTKKGNRKHGYIGEKGIGGVFLITSQPYILSNGYQIRFNETPRPPAILATLSLTALKCSSNTKLLGGVVGFNGSFQLVTENLKPSSFLTSLKADAFLLCFLLDHEWGCLLPVFSCFPIIENAYYGSTISSYKDELRRLGAVVDFEAAVESFANIFRQQASISSITKDDVLQKSSSSSLKMESEKRREAVKCLLNLNVFETSEPITVRYTLSLSSGKTQEVRASRTVYWDRESSKFFTQKLDKSAGHKNLLEYATYFSEVIAVGVLSGKEDKISSLSELIKLAFLQKFNEDASVCGGPRIRFCCLPY